MYSFEEVVHVGDILSDGDRAGVGDWGTFPEAGEVEEQDGMVWWEVGKERDECVG